MSFSRKQALWSIFLSPFLNGRVASFLLEDYIPSFGAEREHSKKKTKKISGICEFIECSRI